MRAAGSLHELRPDAFNYVWDNSIEPALEVEPGDGGRAARARRVRRADPRATRTSSDVLKLDFTHVNPVSGPVFVKGAKPGDVLEVELLEFRPRGWGWTAIIPGFGLLADEFPEPWLRISRVDPERGRVRFAEQRHPAVPSVPGDDRRRARRARRALDRAAVALRRQHRHEAPHPGTTLFLPVGVDGALFSRRRHPRRAGRRRGLRHGDRDGDGRRRAALVRRDFSVDAPQYHVPAGAPTRDGAGALPRLHRRRARPDGGDEGRRARDDRPPRAAPRARPRRRPTRSPASPATCASTRSSTPRTGSSAAGSPSRSSRR